MKEIFDWLREQIGKLHEIDLFTIRYVNRDKVHKLVNEAEAKWNTTEAEIRAKAIEEFAELLKNEYPNHEIDDFLQYAEDCTYQVLGIALEKYIDEIALQMKGEKE